MSKIKQEEQTESLICTYGGESHFDGSDFSEYGIQFNNISISDIKPSEMIKLGCDIINHLIANDHDFDFTDTEGQDQQYKLILSKK